jgi:hypothetical protein
MTRNRNNKFYWFEGVTRNEVIKSLNDTTPSHLRSQATRRKLVIGASSILLALALPGLLTAYMSATHFAWLASYIEFALMFSSGVAYLNLRKSVRHISDAPNELLDERQVAVRDAAYTATYRLLASLSVIYFCVGTAIAKKSDLMLMNVPSGLMASYLMCMASLPAMVLAWTLPSEDHE